MKHFSISFAVLVMILTISSYASADSNLVVNGGFETGDFSGWTQFGNTGFTGVNCMGGTGSFLLKQAHGGDCKGVFGPVGSNGGITSTALATVANQSYDISFWLANNAAGPNNFNVFWDGHLLTTFASAPQFDWTKYDFDVTAAGNDTLTFSFRQDPGFMGLDDVSVTAVGTPEPAMLTMLGLGVAGLRVGRKRLIR